MQVVKYHTGEQYKVAVELRIGSKYAHLLQSNPEGVRLIRVNLREYKPTAVEYNGKPYPLRRAHKILGMAARVRGFHSDKAKEYHRMLRREA